jgi:excisionase family DNA binding protein
MERLLDVRQVAEVLNMSPGVVYYWVKIRKIPFIRMGRRVKFQPSVIAEWISQQRQDVV